MIIGFQVTVKNAGDTFLRRSVDTSNALVMPVEVKKVCFKELSDTVMSML